VRHDAEARTTSVNGEPVLSVRALSRRFGDTLALDDVTFDVAPGRLGRATRYDDAAAAERAVREGRAEAALLPVGEGYEVVGDTGIDPELHAALASAVAGFTMSVHAQQQGADLDRLTAGASLERRLRDPDAEDADAQGVVAVAFAVLFLFRALGFGMSIAQSVVH
jgi:ABC-2 type transport system permease protein